MTKHPFFLTLTIALFSSIPFSCQKENIGTTTEDTATEETQIETETAAVLPAGIHFSGGVVFMDEQEYMTLPVAEATSIEALPGEEISERSGYKKISTPPVGNQGGEGSCTAFATAYCINSYFSWVFNNWNYTNSQAIRSPEAVYNSTKLAGSCDQAGAYLSTVFNFIRDKGVCSWSQMPYSDANGCSVKPNATQLSQGAIGKIKSWQTVTKSVAAVKELVNKGYPLILAFDVNNNFLNQTLKAPYVYKSKSSDNKGGHAAAIVGFDDANQRLIVQNSWGTFNHDKGFFYISYALFPSIARELYVMVPIFPGNIKIRNASAYGDITFQLNGVSKLIHKGQTVEMPAYLAANSFFVWECIGAGNGWNCKWDGDYKPQHGKNYKIIDVNTQWDLKLVSE